VQGKFAAPFLGAMETEFRCDAIHMRAATAWLVCSGPGGGRIRHTKRRLQMVKNLFLIAMLAIGGFVASSAVVVPAAHAMRCVF
jgi:hypothetical protein